MILLFYYRLTQVLYLTVDLPFKCKSSVIVLLVLFVNEHLLQCCQKSLLFRQYFFISLSKQVVKVQRSVKENCLEKNKFNSNNAYHYFIFLYLKYLQNQLKKINKYAYSVYQYVGSCEDNQKVLVVNFEHFFISKHFLDSKITDFKGKKEIFNSFAVQGPLIEKSMKTSNIFKTEVDDLRLC